MPFPGWTLRISEESTPEGGRWPTSAELRLTRCITRQARSELHERVADWLETKAGATTLEFQEVIGYHLEQAYMHKRDLGLVDGHSRAVVLRAGERLASSGLRAFARFDGAGPRTCCVGRSASAL